MSHVITSMLNEQVMEMRLNRPDQLNAISPEMLDGIIAGMKQAEQSREIRAVVLTGEGVEEPIGFQIKYNSLHRRLPSVLYRYGRSLPFLLVIQSLKQP